MLAAICEQSCLSLPVRLSGISSNSSQRGIKQLKSSLGINTMWRQQCVVVWSGTGAKLSHPRLSTGYLTLDKSLCFSLSSLTEWIHLTRCSLKTCLSLKLQLKNTLGVWFLKILKHRIISLFLKYFRYQKYDFYMCKAKKIYGHMIEITMLFQ